MTMGCGRLEYVLDAKHFIHKTNPMDQAKAPKSLKEALSRVVLQRKIKQGMVAKLQVFLLLYHLVKGFAIVSVTRNLAAQYLRNL